jgi:enterochelin esterase family protein
MLKLRQKSFAAYGLLLLASGLYAQPATAPPSPAPDTHLFASVFQPYVDAHTLAGAVFLVATREKVVDEEAVGYADLDAQKPISPDNEFWIASMSKPMTATALMMLVEAGKVNLDDPVEKYLPEFKGQLVKDPKGGPPVAPGHPPLVRELLSHTSGLGGLPNVLQEPLAVRVQSFAKSTLENEPGTKFLYSNAGIDTVGRIVEVASGMPYEQFMQQRIFTPLGMNDTTFWPDAAQISRLAQAYKATPDDRGLAKSLAPLVPPPGGPRYCAFPAGGIFSTAHDLLRFCRMYLQGGVLDGEHYLSEASIALMSQAHTTPSTGGSYGLGWMVAPHGEFFHDGAFRTRMAVLPHEGLVEIFLVQQQGPWPNGGKNLTDLFSETARSLSVPQSTAPEAVPAADTAKAQAPTTRPTPPTRDPNTPGYVTAKDLPDGAVPPDDADGNFIIGPTHHRAAEMTEQPGVPQGTVFNLTMKSVDSKIYPGIARDPHTFGTVDPTDPVKLVVTTSHPATYTRRLAVYVPKQYVPGSAAPFIVGADGPDKSLFTALNNLIAEHKVPVMIGISIGNGSGDAQGSERGLEYDTMSGLYAEFVEKEVLPLVESQCNVKLTSDPDARATMGGSSGGSCALIMAWYHPELYHRVLTYSGTYVNQQWPYNPQTPHGAWGFQENLIPQSPVKPLRIWMEVGDRDNFNPNIMRDGMHDWVLANERMAKVLADKGYHYQFVFARNAGHTDGSVKQQTLPEALEYLWQGFPEAAKSDTGTSAK